FGKVRLLGFFQKLPCALINRVWWINWCATLKANEWRLFWIAISCWRSFHRAVRLVLVNHVPISNVGQYFRPVHGRTARISESFVTCQGRAARRSFKGHELHSNFSALGSGQHYCAAWSITPSQAYRSPRRSVRAQVLL